MLTSHKVDIREAGGVNTFRYHAANKVPLHRIGDAPVAGLEPIVPQDSPFTIPTLQPSAEELAVAEEDPAKARDNYCTESVQYEPRTNGFWSTRTPKKSHLSPKNEEWIIRYEKDHRGQRAYTPDHRGRASVAEKHRLAEAEEFFDDNMARLNAAHAAWLAECELDPERAPPSFSVRAVTPPPPAAVAQPAPPRLSDGNDREA